MSSPGHWFRARNLGLSHPHLSMSPFRWNAFAISCPPGHKLQFPAGNSPLQQRICRPMPARVGNEVHGVDYFCFSCRWQFLCCFTPNSKRASSWRFELHRPACVRVMAPPGLDLLCDSLHLLALSLPEKRSSYLPFCKPSTPYLAKRFGDIFLRLTCSNEALHKYVDVWTGWKVFAWAHPRGRLLGHASSVPSSQTSGFCWVGFLPWGKCIDPSLALKPLTHNSYLFLKSYMWSLPWEVSQLRSMWRPLSHFWIIQQSTSAWTSSTRKKCPTSWLGKERFHRVGKAICYPGRATCIQGSANMFKDFLGQEWTFNAFQF